MRTTQAIVALFAVTAYGRVVRRAAFADGDACIAAKALADGIQSNIDLQTGEQASVEKVKAAVSQNPVDQAAFTAAKTQLLDFVNAGIGARENNQAIAPEGNAAIAGLAVVSLRIVLAEFTWCTWLIILRVLGTKSPGRGTPIGPVSQGRRQRPRHRLEARDGLCWWHQAEPAERCRRECPSAFLQLIHHFRPHQPRSSGL